MATPAIRNRFAGQGDRITDSGVEKWVNIFGDVQVIKNLERLENSIQRKYLKKAIAKGLKPVVKTAKRKAHKKSGLLRSSIKSAVTKMASGKVYVDPKVFAVKNNLTGGKMMRVKVKGEKAGYRETIAAIKKAGGETEIQKPANYAHILEFGSQKRNIKSQPFMRPAMTESRNQVINNIADELRQALKQDGAT